MEKMKLIEGMTRILFLLILLNLLRSAEVLRQYSQCMSGFRSLVPVVIIIVLLFLLCLGIFPTKCKRGGMVKIDEGGRRKHIMGVSLSFVCVIIVMCMCINAGMDEGIKDRILGERATHKMDGDREDYDMPELKIKNMEHHEDYGSEDMPEKRILNIPYNPHPLPETTEDSDRVDLEYGSDEYDGNNDLKRKVSFTATSKGVNMREWFKDDSEVNVSHGLTTCLMSIVYYIYITKCTKLGCRILSTLHGSRDYFRAFLTHAFSDTDLQSFLVDLVRRHLDMPTTSSGQVDQGRLRQRSEDNHVSFGCHRSRCFDIFSWACKANDCTLFGEVVQDECGFLVKFCFAVHILGRLHPVPIITPDSSRKFVECNDLDPRHSLKEHIRSLSHGRSHREGRHRCCEARAIPCGPFWDIRNYINQPHRVQPLPPIQSTTTDMRVISLANEWARTRRETNIRHYHNRNMDQHSQRGQVQNCQSETPSGHGFRHENRTSYLYHIHPTPHVADVANVVSLRQRETCVICEKDRRKVVFMPCRHLASCQSCAKNVTDCPLCMTHITGRVVITID